MECEREGLRGAGAGSASAKNRVCYCVGLFGVVSPVVSGEAVVDVGHPSSDGLGSTELRDASISAFSSSGGNTRPLRRARSRIPVQARALKKYRRRWSPVSKMSDNEDTIASLGNTEALSVKYSPTEAIPALNHAGEEVLEGSAVIVGEGVSRKDAGDVLPNHPAGAESASKEKKLDGQVTTRVIQSSSSSGDGEGLAGRSSDKNVNWFRGGCIDSNPGEGAEVGRAGMTSERDTRGEVGDLRAPRAPHTQRRPRCGHGGDAVAYGAVDETAHRSVSSVGSRLRSSTMTAAARYTIAP